MLNLNSWILLFFMRLFNALHNIMSFSYVFFSIDLVEELCTVALCFCQGEYVVVLSKPTAAELFGTNDVIETCPG